MSDHFHFDPPSGAPAPEPTGAYPPPPPSGPTPPIGQASPGEPPFGAPSGPSSASPMAPGPVQPSGPGRGTLVAVGVGAAVLAGAGVFGFTQIVGGDDDADTVDRPTVSATLPPGAQAALDEAQQAADRAREDADDLLADVLSSIPPGPGTPSVPAIPHGEPSDRTDADGTDDTGDTGGSNGVGDPGVVITLPDLGQLDRIGACIGIDFGDLLGSLGGLDPKIFDIGELPGQLDDFDEMTPEELAGLDVAELLEEMFAEMNNQLGDPDVGGLPPLSVPFDLDILGELDLGALGDIVTMSPEEIQELIESQLGDLGDLATPTGTLPAIPPMSIPPWSQPPWSIPTDLDPAAVEECLAELAE